MPQLSRTIRAPLAAGTVALCLAVVSLTACTRSDATNAVPVPPALSTLESLAEDAFDSALAGNQISVQSQAVQISVVWMGVRPDLERAGVPAGPLTELGTAISRFAEVATSGRTAGLALARAANAVSAPMDEVFDVYRPTVPAILPRLDYLGREVWLDARELSLSRASEDTDQIGASWQGLRGQVAEAGGDVVADDVDAAIAALRASIQAGDGPALETAATAMLELIDRVEEVFARPSAPPA